MKKPDFCTFVSLCESIRKSADACIDNEAQTKSLMIEPMLEFMGYTKEYRKMEQVAGSERGVPKKMLSAAPLDGVDGLSSPQFVKLFKDDIGCFRKLCRDGLASV